jgi:hypothetical protein
MKNLLNKFYNLTIFNFVVYKILYIILTLCAVVFVPYLISFFDEDLNKYPFFIQWVGGVLYIVVGCFALVAIAFLFSVVILWIIELFADITRFIKWLKTKE